MILATLRIELLKTLKRRAFWVSLGLLLLFFLPLLYAAFGRGGVVQVSKTFSLSISLPQGWGLLLDLQGLDMAEISRLFVPVLLTILVGSEFVFKTSRQNIIDGLTREQFFIAKVWSVLIVAAAFFAVYLVLGFLFGFVLVDSSARTGAIMRLADVQMMGGFLVMLVGFGLLAMLFGVAVRNTGTASGLFFFYIIVVEQIAPQLLRLKESLKPIAEALDYLPGKIFREIVRPARYDVEHYSHKLSQMTGQPVSFAIGTDVAWMYAVGYVALFAAASYLILKNTDL